MHSMVKVVRSFRLQMLIIFSYSILLSFSITYFIYKGLQFYYHKMVYAGDLLAQLRQIMGRVGEVNFFSLLFIPLSIFFFFYLTKPYSNYFKEISKGIRYLAMGDFKHRVYIQSNNEFSDIAHDINLAGDKLEEAVQRGDFSENSKEQLVVNLAHDIRTPLTSVLGYLDLLQNDENLTREQIKHFLSIAYTKSQRLEKLVDELFEITKINYGMLPIDKKQINLTDLLNQLIEELFPVFEKNQLIARMNVSSQLFILGDGDLLARVFENLLINTNRYGYDGKFVDINGFVDEGEVVIQITNYGDHIPSDELPFIFDMFYTGDKARTAKEDSTGLGLFIAKNIVEQHNGTITADSSVIRTVFEVHLPQESERKNLQI